MRGSFVIWGDVGLGYPLVLVCYCFMLFVSNEKIASSQGSQVAKKDLADWATNVHFKSRTNDPFLASLIKNYAYCDLFI